MNICTLVRYLIDGKRRIRKANSSSRLAGLDFALKYVNLKYSVSGINMLDRYERRDEYVL